MRLRDEGPTSAAAKPARLAIEAWRPSYVEECAAPISLKPGPRDPPDSSPPAPTAPNSKRRRAGTGEWLG
jgi:hypothetical protein